MKAFFNRIISLYLERRYRQIEHYMSFPHEVQERVFQNILSKGKLTRYGKKHGFGSISNQIQYANQVPITSYEDIHSLIDKMMHGEKDCLWPGQIKWFSKSSGTTNDKSKYIPVSKESLKNGHIKSSWDVVTFLYHNKPESRVFSDKNLVMGGSLTSFEPYPSTVYGDVSAIMLQNMPAVGRPFYTPDFETALLSDWNEKLERMVVQTIKENVVMFGGVPTWIIVLFNHILDYTGKQNMLEVWPDLQVFVHGGVGFGPYKDQFAKLIPKEDFSYLEVYNASEGYFGIQNDLNEDGMLLLLDNGIYYEFIPMHVWGTDREYAVPLAGVELGINYAMVITTNSGLWRYQPGDTITFTSITPYKIKISGRTKHYINVFGEELMVSNTDQALAQTCQEYGIQALEYTVGPIFMDNAAQGGHEWIIEFEDMPNDVESFALSLDDHIKRLNSDYEAKRYGDLALKRLKLNIAPKGTFISWMESRGKVGGQYKIPRLSNNREILESILKITV